MKILLLGHDGQIGWELGHGLSCLGEVRGLSFPEVDFTDEQSLRDLVRSEAPELIVNAAAYTNVDGAEKEEELAHAVNSVAPRILAEEAERRKALFVHYSTDFVFDGHKGSPYGEDDVASPLGFYGKTKLEGDRAVEAVGGSYLVLRTSWIYGLRGRNFLLTMRRLAEEGKRLRVVDDQVGSPTWCASVARATISVLERVVGGGDLRADDVAGVYNMACHGETSWYGFAREFLHESVEIDPISTMDYPTPAQRPSYSVLDCGKLEKTFGVTMPSWREALSECVGEEKG
jgi:dTDP-4-dehydrorhamnose reductase